MVSNTPEYTFMPSEEARLILGYLYDRGLDKTANSFLDESDALKEYRLQARARRNSCSRMLGLDLSQILDGYYKQQYAPPGENTPKSESSVTLMCFKGTQTSNPAVESVGCQTMNPVLESIGSQTKKSVVRSVGSQIKCHNLDSRGTQTSAPTVHSLGFQIMELPQCVQSIGIQATSLLGVPVTTQTDTWSPMSKITSPNPPPNHSGISNFRRAVERQNERLSRGETTRTADPHNVAQFLMDGDTFDVASRIEDSVGASRRKSSLPRKSLIGGHELSNSQFTPPADLFAEPTAECVDAVFESMGNERILNDILGIRPDELESNEEGELTPGFASPNSSSITPRRVNLLQCTPSPGKRTVRPRRKPTILLSDPPVPFLLPGELELPFEEVTPIKRRGVYQKRKTVVPKSTAPKYYSKNGPATKRKNSKN